jgi:trk system potassium uptake protein TrkA
MKVIVSGCGKIGTAIVESLLKEKHDITVIDVDKGVVERVTNRYDVLGYLGNGASYDVLLGAGADKCDLFISVTASDEFNMLSCFVAKKAGAKNTVARIRNSEYNNDSLEFIKNELGLNVIINPELLTAQTIFNVLELPSATSIEVFSSSETEMIELSLKEDSKALGIPLYELRKKHDFNFLVCLVNRDGEVYIPNGHFTLQAGDRIGVFVSKSNTRKLLKAFGLEHKPIKSVMIIGASKTAHYLSKLLTDAKTSVKLIEIDKDKCEEFSSVNDKISVINGDGMSQDLLLEEGILEVDAFVTLTGKDEQNVLMSVYSQGKNVQKTLTKINREEILDISKSIGLETVINSKNLVADVLVRYARALENSKESKIETLYSLLSGNAEAGEFKVLSDFKHTNIPLKNLKINENILIAGIIRNREIIIPCGEDVILEGDKVIVITAGLSLMDLGDIIK